MLVATVRMTALRAVALLMALGVIVAAVLWPAPRAAAVLEAGSRSVAGLSTNEKRLEYIHSLGWTVEPEPLEVVELTIPRTFNAVYRNYNALQQKQGFDLSAFRGARVKRWTYRVTNYPGQTDGVRLNLLLYGDRVIGGDVSTVALNGFMQGLSRSAADAAVSSAEADITGGIFTRTVSP